MCVWVSEEVALSLSLSLTHTHTHKLSLALMSFFLNNLYHSCLFFQHGFGIYLFYNGDKYTGLFKEDRFHGNGTYHVIAPNIILDKRLLGPRLIDSSISLNDFL